MWIRRITCVSTSRRSDKSSKTIRLGRATSSPSPEWATVSDPPTTIEQAGPLRIRHRYAEVAFGPDPASCASPATIIFATPLPNLPQSVYENGVEVIVSSFYRSRQLGDAKTGNLLRSVLALREAKAAGAFEAITLTSEGKISDGITSNVYLVQDSTLLTPSAESGILEGITRAVVLDLAKRAGLKVVEALLEVGEIEKSSELFLTSSTRGVVPIVRVSGKAIGSGKPGPLTRQLMDAYDREIETLLAED